MFSHMTSMILRMQVAMFFKLFILWRPYTCIFPLASTLNLCNMFPLTCFFVISLFTSSSSGTVLGPVITSDFPDPAIINDGGTWYAFATESAGIKVQMATSPDFWNWTLTGQDALGELPAWIDSSNPRVWAPDVVRLDDGSFLMYYSAATKTIGGGKFHCVGTATSSSVEGPYNSNSDTPFACPTDSGGAIDPDGFQDADGTRYVLYKVDGNAIGHGGLCGNAVDPIVSTPIMIQQVESDGVTRVGGPMQLITNGPADGPLVEAPSMSRTGNGTYVLFFSSNCYSTKFYDVSYATSENAIGGFVKAPNPLFVTGTHGLIGPGGADVVGNKLVFHGYGKQADVGGKRSMYVATFDVTGHTVSSA